MTRWQATGYNGRHHDSDTIQKTRSRKEEKRRMKTADVFVNIPVKSIARAYTYRVPQELAKIEAGWRVFVPFGSRKVEGFVVETHEDVYKRQFGM